MAFYLLAAALATTTVASSGTQAPATNAIKAVDGHIIATSGG